MQQLAQAEGPGRLTASPGTSTSSPSDPTRSQQLLRLSGLLLLPFHRGGIAVEDGLSHLLALVGGGIAAEAAGSKGAHGCSRWMHCEIVSSATGACVCPSRYVIFVFAPRRMARIRGASTAGEAGGCSVEVSSGPRPEHFHRPGP